LVLATVIFSLCAGYGLGGWQGYHTVNYHGKDYGLAHIKGTTRWISGGHTNDIPEIFVDGIVLVSFVLFVLFAFRFFEGPRKLVTIIVAQATVDKRFLRSLLLGALTAICSTVAAYLVYIFIGTITGVVSMCSSAPEWWCRTFFFMVIIPPAAGIYFGVRVGRRCFRD
jgi:hypothetical protein